MNLRVQKLDKRMNGHDRFTHRVIFVGRDVVRYQTALTKARNYLWAAFGPSGELEIARPPFFAETPLYALDRYFGSVRTQAQDIRDIARNTQRTAEAVEE